MRRCASHAVFFVYRYGGRSGWFRDVGCRPRPIIDAGGRVRHAPGTDRKELIMANTTITDNAVLNTIDMADRDTARTEFARVCEYLHGQRELDARLISSMARMLSMRLAVRDALIIAAIRPAMVDAAAMAAFAFEPHEPRTATLMGRLLSGAFDTGDGYDAETLDRFDTLVGEAGHEPDAPDAQCLAVRAYLAWWKRDKDTAMRLAFEALALSEDCTLAGIVCAALTRGIMPREQA